MLRRCAKPCNGDVFRPAPYHKIGMTGTIPSLFKGLCEPHATFTIHSRPTAHRPTDRAGRVSLGGLMLRPVKALISALVASMGLSACVAVDRQASVSPEGGIVPTAFSQPLAAPQQQTAMPGDLLLNPDKVERGVDPVAILMRPPMHAAASAARAPASSASTLAARLEASPTRQLRGMAAPPAASTPAAAVASADDSDGSVTTAMRAALTRPTLPPLGDVEARALAEQRAQDLRDKRFDRQVRHASSIVCSGCVTNPGRRSRAPVPDEAVGE